MNICVQTASSFQVVGNNLAKTLIVRGESDIKYEFSSLFHGCFRQTGSYGKMIAVRNPFHFTLLWKLTDEGLQCLVFMLTE